ncbi:MAG: hypothetical protein JNJ54_14655 [Myxococcaceae bacterium]|nr:hypothetical protein [Myxococcaceae bacterium]
MTEPFPHELEALRRWLTALDERCLTRPLPEATHFIVTPLGWPDRSAVEGALQRLGVRVQTRLVLSAWPRLSTVLQVTRRTSEALRRALLFERVWAKVAPDEPAEAWEVSLDDATLLAHHKRALREPLRNVTVDFAGRLPRPSTLHALHLADADDFFASSRRLFTALELGAPL